jgi:hypothetical protein
MEPIPRHNPARLIAVGAAALLVLLVAAVIYLLVQSSGAAPQKHRVDELVANYNAHIGEFRTIAQLASVEATFGIDVSSGSLGSNDIDSTDVPGYSAILTALHDVGAQHVSASDHAVDVTTSSEGLAVSGRESGYYYTASPDVETVTLDVARSPDAPQYWLYPLGDGWYASEYRF